MQLFYAPDLKGKRYKLGKEETKHCVRVLRYKVGTCVYLTNGKGDLYIAEFVNIDPNGAELNVIDTIQNYQKRNYYLHIVIAPTKNTDRFEWFLEKSTEIGIDEITPIFTEHSERKQIKNERLERVIIAALKQSIKACLPKLNPMVSFNKFMQNNSSVKGGYIAHCHNQPKQRLKDVYKKGEDVIILIGPEGDFSDKEIKLALSKGFIPVSLSESRLRTETAGVVACNTVDILNQ
ncbi:MAG: 16S rRNA (uracil(1498)-N(3))-methyltransferase [Bacteroidales bacterium]|nr:16S rRNA (uracil(1498)-N(3))-methyltransferase [Bacteroidales bacterium]